MTAAAPAPAWSTGALVLAYDRTRERSQQTDMGMSEVGGCRRRAGYRLAGTPATDETGSLQAALGVAIHDGVARMIHHLRETGVIPAEDLVEHEVRFGGVRGHLDRYDSATCTVDDTKTTSDRFLRRVMADGPPRNHRWQVQLYAAALIVDGRRVDWVALDYIARDTGAEHRWTERPDPAMVREALAWIDEVRSAELDMLPREYDPDGPFCGSCAFRTLCWDLQPDQQARDPRSVLFRDDPDAAAWAARLDDARQRKADAEADEKAAKGALDALRPNDVGTATVDVGWTKALQWRVSQQSRMDNDQVREHYRQAGAEPPMKPATRRVELSLVARTTEEKAS